MDCYVCNNPQSVVFGNGASDYYNFGNANFTDVKPSYWTGSNTHRLWIK